jgi:hypothetical protein
MNSSFLRYPHKIITQKKLPTLKTPPITKKRVTFETVKDKQKLPFPRAIISGCLCIIALQIHKVRLLELRDFLGKVKPSWKMGVT